MRRHISPVSSKGQVTIPAAIRRQLNVDETSQVAFVVSEDGRVELQPVRYTLESVLGALPLPEGEPGDFREAIEAAWEEAAAERMRRIGGQ